MKNSPHQKYCTGPPLQHSVSVQMPACSIAATGFLTSQASPKRNTLRRLSSCRLGDQGKWIIGRDVGDPCWPLRSRRRGPTVGPLFLREGGCWVGAWPVKDGRQGGMEKSSDGGWYAIPSRYNTKRITKGGTTT